MDGWPEDALFERAPVALLLIDRFDVVLDENEAFRALGLGSWLGHRWTDLLAVGDRIYHETNVRPALLRRGHVEQLAVTLRAGDVRVDGFVGYRSAPTGTDGPTIVAFTAADERRRYEDELRSARDRARAASERLARIARMSAALVSVATTAHVEEVLDNEGPEVLGVQEVRCWIVDDDAHEVRAGGRRMTRLEHHRVWDALRGDGTLTADDAAFVPVVADERVIAVMELCPPPAPDADDLVSSVADQVAAALVRTRTTELAVATATHLSLTDALTQVPNRRFAERELELRAARSAPFAVALVDVDHFKRCNDEHGHDVGDTVLVAIAARLQGVVRRSDVLARWGGEEFLAVLGARTPGEAAATAERMRCAVGDHPVAAAGTALPVTVSVGLAVAAPGEAPLDVLRRADAHLYAAKRGGRNTVVADLPAAGVGDGGRAG